MDAAAISASTAGGGGNSGDKQREPSKPVTQADGTSNQQAKRARPRRKKKPQKSPETPQQQVAPSAEGPVKGQGNGKKNNQQTRKNPPSRQRQKQRFPWRKHIPPGTDDPITLESLVSLSYPPFALVSSAPYEPVPEWPIPKASQTESQEAVETTKENEEERQRRILQEQWGTKAPQIIAEETVTSENNNDDAPVEKSKSDVRHYHLFDGRALAYYMVSQLQFIDPMNRRDLTRPEIVNLDKYLSRHGFSGLSVAEAYDKRGITISTAGAVGNTEAGRAAILQQEATQLLNTLFGTPTGGRPPAATTAPSANRLRAQYQAHLDDEPTDTQRPLGRRSRQEHNATHGPGGFLVIDDTLYPHLRGSTSTRVAHDEATGLSTTSNPLWSASHITSTARSITPQPLHFPALSETVERTQPPENAAAANLLPGKKAAATLSVITKAVKKTDPEELQRQREAREDARRRAAAANLPFGVQPPDVASSSQPPLSSITTVREMTISDAQLERNMAMADALGINTKGTVVMSDKADFEQELKSVVYPDALILQAKERSSLLLKLEKKWSQLVKDESSSSLSLTSMDRTTRIFVHEYSDYWNLETQSYDPEGKRYIHCRKQLDTRIPHPLLSDAVRFWKGPSSIVRPLPTGPEANRVPLPLKPRTVAVDHGAPDKVGVGITVVGKDVLEATNSRVNGLVAERLKLQLQNRTLPLELPPPVEVKEEYNIAEEMERQRQRAQEKARKEKARKAREQRALEAAFASDDDASLDSGVELRGAW